ncbi:MAG: saccharopine dehydrogenase, partial [Bacteroidetes bacterium]
ARTTGYTCTAVANLVINGDYNHEGISPPEYLGESEENFRFIRNYLEERGVVYHLSEE